MKKDLADLSRGIAFHEKIAANWSNGYSRQTFARRLSSFAVVFDHAIAADQRWLDLGCGSGVLSIELLKRRAIVTALDGSPAMLEEAKKLASRHCSVIEAYIQSDVTDLRMIDDGSFDGVLCSSVVEYLDSPNSILPEIARVLRSNGKLILSLPPKMSAIRTVQKCIRWFTSIFGLEKFAYLSVSKFEIDPVDVEPWLESAGFAVERISPFDALLPEAFLRIFRPSLMIVEARKL